MTDADAPTLTATPTVAPPPASPTAAAPTPDVQPEPVSPPAPGSLFRGTGRRKSSVARVRLTPGDGKIVVNGRPLESYFTEPADRSAVAAPFNVTNSRGLFNADVSVLGGGHSGQAGAALLGIARALTKFNQRYEPKLRDSRFLTRDSREVERKKYGQAGARRRFQFSKR